MLLRSSSTPILGSSLPSFSDSPSSNHHHHHHHPEFSYATSKHHPSNNIHHNQGKLAIHQAACHNFTTFSCSSFPISPSIAEPSLVGRSSQNGFRRVQSEGNLEGLLDAACKFDGFSFSTPSKKSSRRPNCSVLERIPSFSLNDPGGKCEDEDDDEEEQEELEESYDIFGGQYHQGNLRGVKVNESNPKIKNMGLREEMRGHRHVAFHEKIQQIEGISSPMYLATGLGVTGVDLGFGNGGGSNGGDGGDGRDFTPIAFGRGGGDEKGLEEHYKKMVDENPGNSLFLRNYAKFLHHEKQRESPPVVAFRKFYLFPKPLISSYMLHLWQTKRELDKAEEYYSRAILADPEDGDILSQYAKLVWERHRDKERATGYFERAIQAAPENSHVHAAYTTFLWETEEEDEDEDEDFPVNGHNVMPPLLLDEALAPATV